jgi:hydrogenase maturation protein HypF
VLPGGQIDLRPLVLSSLIDVDRADPSAVAEAAARFHLTLADALCAQAIARAQMHQLRDVALGGGCFFNHILTQRIVSQLETAGLNVLQTKNLSCGDAGLALGQAWVAARTMRCENVPVALVEYASSAAF